MARRIGGAGGGSDKGSGSGGGVLAGAVLLVGAVAISGGGAGVGVGVATSAGSALDSTVVQRIESNTTKAKDSASKGSEDEAWRRMALQKLKKVGETALTCIAYSHGQVRQFFIHAPCRSLHRGLLALADNQGNIIVVSIAWVQMPSTGSAQRFRRLIDTYGTGDVYPIGSELLGLGGIRFTGQHYDSRLAGTLVVVAETERATGQPRPELLNGIAVVAAQFPPPI